MTIEEAKEYLLNISYMIGTTAVEYMTQKDGEKIREAIKVLGEQEWIPPIEWVGKMNNDLISRQAAIDAILAVTGNSSVRELYEHVQEHGLSEMWSGGVNAAIDTIIAVPSAQPEITDLQFLQPESEYVFYDSDHGFCINTQDVLDCLRKELRNG